MSCIEKFNWLPRLDSFLCSDLTGVRFAGLFMVPLWLIYSVEYFIFKGFESASELEGWDLAEVILPAIVGAAMIGNKIRLFFAINNFNNKNMSVIAGNFFLRLIIVKNMSVIAGNFFLGLIIVPCLIVGGIFETISYWPTGFGIISIVLALFEFYLVLGLKSVHAKMMEIKAVDDPEDQPDGAVGHEELNPNL